MAYYSTQRKERGAVALRSFLCSQLVEIRRDFALFACLRLGEGRQVQNDGTGRSCEPGAVS